MIKGFADIFNVSKEILSTKHRFRVIEEKISLLKENNTIDSKYELDSIKF